MSEPTSKPLADRVSFAEVTAADFEDVLRLRIAAMQESLERLGRFDPVRARERLQRSFYPEHSQFVLLDGQQAGFYTLRPVSDDLHLDHFYIHPQFQSQGIGSYVLRQLLVRADAQQLPIRLGALRGSRSNTFYQRHGFVQTAEDEWDIYYVRSTPANVTCRVRIATAADVELWVQLRHQLWPAHDLTELQTSASSMLQAPTQICFLLTTLADEIIGFLEGAIYEPAFGPYAHVEGWYVRPEYRGCGLGGQLMSTFEQWCLHRTIARISSDTTPKYPLSPKAHAAAGFRKIHEFTIFLKELTPSADR